MAIKLREVFYKYCPSTIQTNVIYCIPHLLEKHDVATLLVLPKGEGREPSHLRNIMSAGTTQRSGFRLEEFYRNVYICKKNSIQTAKSLKKICELLKCFSALTQIYPTAHTTATIPSQN